MAAHVRLVPGALITLERDADSRERVRRLRSVSRRPSLRSTCRPLTYLSPLQKSLLQPRPCAVLRHCRIFWAKRFLSVKRLLRARSPLRVCSLLFRVITVRVRSLQDKEGVVARGLDQEGVQGLSPPPAHSFLKDPAVIYTHTRSRRLSESLCGREGEEGGKRARGKERGSSKYSER